MHELVERGTLTMYLIDAHEDLAYNVLTFGRNYFRSALETRQIEREKKSIAPKVNGDSMLGWPDYQEARAAVVFATLFAAPIRRKQGTWDTTVYATTDEAHKLYQAQLDIYHRWFDDAPEKFTPVLNRGDLGAQIERWENVPGGDAGAQGESGRDKRAGETAGARRQSDLAGDRENRSREAVHEESPAGHPVGLVILMEGAEGVRSVDELELWWERGVRIVGPAWAGTRFCGGTGEPGPLTSEGEALLEGLAHFGFILDLSHMDQAAALQALDSYNGKIIASHANALAVLKGSDSNRHLTDRVIEGIVERDGVIGVVPFNAFLKHGWRPGDRRGEVTLTDLVNQVDHICQVAGSAAHAGIGSDFDGGFGLTSTPVGLDTIADLHAIRPLLAERGYSEADIDGVVGGNWARMLAKGLPE